MIVADREVDHRPPSIDDAFASNRLLSTFPDEERALIEPKSSLVMLRQGEEVLNSGREVVQTLFPFDGTLVSLMVDLDDRRGVEVASIGSEGAIGGIVSCGFAPAFSRAHVQSPGPALRVAMGEIEAAKGRSAFLRNLFCRYSDFLLSQVMQSAACNAFHPIDARAARWLLTAQDRTGGDRVTLTQDSLAQTLGVQRTTVNAAVRALSDAGLIANRRGTIQVRDRSGLKDRACECYVAVENHFASIIGDTGFGTRPGG